MPKSPAPKPSAPQCPACQRELSLLEASLAQCPHCGESLSAAGGAGSGPDASKATVAGIGQTIQSDDLAFQVPAKPSTGDQPGAGRGTIDESQQRKTVDERSLPSAPPPKAPPGSQTLDERAIGQTLDEDALRALAQSQPPPSPGKGQRTIDARQL